MSIGSMSVTARYTHTHILELFYIVFWLNQGKLFRSVGMYVGAHTFNLLHRNPFDVN